MLIFLTTVFDLASGSISVDQLRQVSIKKPYDRLEIMSRITVKKFSFESETNVGNNEFVIIQFCGFFSVVEYLSISSSWLCISACNVHACPNFAHIDLEVSHASVLYQNQIYYADDIFISKHSHVFLIFLPLLQ
jgi:hypothetical protein